ncbi:hypothetical protein B0H16DRAFT_1726897 [Mycena metata]|uniref:Uncharacterized protein n=1 Tax=Mycena metata TaxID=1033252 RepID=A0AAD7IL49_9AGAR|nr:hypothetical protein B0H16DRAFT_1726897 [Mycena metata]
MITLALGTLGYKYVHIYEDPAFFIFMCVAGGVAPSTDAWIAAYAADELGDLLGALWLVLSAVANSIIDVYSMGLSVSVINVSLAKVPRLIMAIPSTSPLPSGRQLVLEDLMNERPLDWLSIHVVVVLSSTSSSARATLRATRRRRRNRQDRAPVGIAVLIAFLFGAVGTAMGMAQVSYIGKIGVLFRAFSSSYPFYVSPDITG